MRHLGHLVRLVHEGNGPLPDLPPPNPWLMALVLIGAGGTLWWLMPEIVRRREESRRAARGDRSSRQRWPDVVPADFTIAGRAACAVLVLGGLVLLGIQMAGG